MDIKTGRFLITGLLILGAIVGSKIALADLRDGYIPTATDQTDRGRPDSFADLVQAVGPAVVSISTRIGPTRQNPGDTKRPLTPGSHPPVPGFHGDPEFERFLRRFFGPRHSVPGPHSHQRRTVGSGFIIDGVGLVVTNHHVVANADEIEVVLADGRTLPARVKGHDRKTDIALLQIESDEIFPTVSFGDSTKARVGDWVIAIGNPFGLGGTATTGIISARGRDINSGPYDDYIQIDAPINRGNSGGPLFDTSGLVIGVNTAIYSPSGGNVGIGFAVPAEQAQRIIRQLRAQGVVQRAWLGVHIQTVTPDLAGRFGLHRAHGALVSKVEPGSPAYKSGMVPGDIILEFDGKPVNRMRRLPRLVAQAVIGNRVEVGLWRDGRKITVYPEMQGNDDGTLVAGQPAQRSQGTASLGLLLSTLDPESRQHYGFDADVTGILIEQVRPDSPAAEKGLQRGDLIVQVERRPVDTPAGMTRLLNSARQKNQKAVLLLIERQGQAHFVALRLT